jgi:hypothetical protein
MTLQGTPPAPPQAPAPAGVVGGTTAPSAPSGATAAEVYQALRAQRSVLGEQLRGLERTRDGLVADLRQGTVSDMDRTGIEQRLAQVDQRIASVSLQIAEADAQVAAAAAVPGATVQPPRPPRSGPDPDIVAMGLVFTGLMLFPLVVAWARRLWRKHAVTIALTPELGERLQGLEQAVESVALEVERIGEGQRFVTQLMAERARPMLAERERDGHV